MAGCRRYAAGYLDEALYGMTTFADRPLEEQIAQWRASVRRPQALHGPDVEELEGHLRDQLVILAGTRDELHFIFPAETIWTADVWGPGPPKRNVEVRVGELERTYRRTGSSKTIRMEFIRSYKAKAPAS